MALGLEQAIAEFLAAPPAPEASFGGLYDDADASNRIIFVQEQPPVPVLESDELDDPNSYQTTAELAITVFTESGGAPTLTLTELHSITVQCRHRSYETAMQTSRRIGRLLHENGGQSNGARVGATGVFPNGVRIFRITADFQPVRIGRDEGERGGRYVTTQTFTVRTKPVPL